jgi:hypothetical protein
MQLRTTEFGAVLIPRPQCAIVLHTSRQPLAPATDSIPDPATSNTRQFWTVHPLAAPDSSIPCWTAFEPAACPTS